MQRIPLAKAKPGMVLAQPVARPDGLVLMGAGTVLTEDYLERIRKVGVGTVSVEGNPLGGAGTVGDLRIIAEQLPFLFRRHKDDVFMMTLCSVFSRHFMRRMAEQRAMEDAAIEAGKEARVATGEDSGGAV